ncbi:hypothetical protein QZH41_002565 [Actinostola sp. cb2023]|nr:hypothetical protein QZH41_002565 [Actinostola sp. cb2023]
MRSSSSASGIADGDRLALGASCLKSCQRKRESASAIALLTPDVVAKSKNAYEEATVSSANLPATDPIHLGLVLNFSVFNYEILNDQAKASMLFGVGSDENDVSYEPVPKLEHGLQLWTSENDDDNQED